MLLKQKLERKETKKKEMLAQRLAEVKAQHEGHADEDEEAKEWLDEEEGGAGSEAPVAKQVAEKVRASPFSHT